MVDALIEEAGVMDFCFLSDGLRAGAAARTTWQNGYR